VPSCQARVLPGGVAFVSGGLEGSRGGSGVSTGTRFPEFKLSARFVPPLVQRP
jgi:hypothetical protein